MFFRLWTLGNYLLSQAKLVELIENALDHVDRLIFQLCDLGGKRLNLIVRQVLVYCGRIIRTHCRENQSDLLVGAEFFCLLTFCHICPPLVRLILPSSCS